MKTVFNQKNTLYKENQDKINHKINKRFREFKYFFNRYIDPDEEKECVVCKSKNLTKFINQFRHFFFWDKRLDNDDMHYYCDIQFKLHEEYLLICDYCKLIFSQYKLDDKFYDDYFKFMHDLSDPLNYDENTLKIDKLYATEKNDFRFKIIGKYISLNEKILEVSSYRGWGLNDMKEKYDVYGVEPDYLSYKFCLSKFKDLKDKIHYGVFDKSEDFLLNHGKFNGIIFSQCFRHIPSPRKSLELLKKISYENSYVFVDESLMLDTIYNEFKDGNKNLENLNESFIHGKKFYYSTPHLVNLFHEYGFKFVEKYKFESKKVQGLELDLLVFKKTNEILSITNNLDKKMFFMNDFLNLFDKKYQNKKVYKFSINKSLVDKIKTKLRLNS